MARSRDKKTAPSTAGAPSAKRAASSTNYPPPFVAPPSALSSSFLSTLPTSHVYIVHIDTTPAILKRRVFLVPVCMNLCILAAIGLRLYYAYPTYIALVLSVLGHSTSATVDTKRLSYTSLAQTTVNRTMLFLGDYLLIAFLGSWPWVFVFGTAQSEYSSPLKWRYAIGFQDREVVVRRSRKWDKNLLPNWTLDDELTIKHKILPAVTKDRLEKSGYLLLDKDWDLDFLAMTDAHRLISEGELQMSDFDRAVVVYHQPSKSWMVWQLAKLDNITASVRAQAEDIDPKTAAQRETILKFKDKLTALGQEDLFYRWIELVQYESSLPGGFTEGRQAQAMRDVRRMFEERGLDFAKFWDEIDGQKGMPGLVG